MNSSSEIKRIVISGPESSGKTSTTEYLAKEFCTVHIPEYAREITENKKNIYTYNDVIGIARKQIEQLSNPYPSANKFVFFDTGLIITKIWFEEVYKKVPVFLLKAIEKIKIDLCLLCYPDIEWVQDKVRVNKGEKRFSLFIKYKQELERYGTNYEVVKGKGNDRFLCAKNFVTSAYCL